MIVRHDEQNIRSLLTERFTQQRTREGGEGSKDDNELHWVHVMTIDSG